MKYLTGAQIRQMWLDFFASKNHMIEPGAPLVPINDPTLLWINSGVAALKRYFDGREKPQNPRIVNAQKSIRTNDIENVGYTARHHTFFEMLGNFSIGDYFRKEAIHWGWELLTSPQWFGFKPVELYMTIHPDDEESKKIWLSLGVAPDHIVPVEGNFWQIGEGPCGPNTEIFVDRGPKFDPQGLGVRLLHEDISNDRYIEIWNIVFSQFNAKEGLPRDQYPELPQKNIDTGAGLERIACIFQQGETNFDTDLFLPMIHATEAITGKTYQGENKMAFRVIADHIRSCTFALADGATFSNEGRGYVLRRLLRRALRFGKKLGTQQAFMYRLVQVVADTMKDFYPYLQEKVPTITRLIKAEEDRFLTTINAGEQMLKEYLDHANNSQIPGAVAFKLYDTFGFPIELTLEIANERHFQVDLEGFKKEMNIQKDRARQARVDIQSMHHQSKDLLAFETPSRFTYVSDPLVTRVIGIFVEGVQVERADGPCEIILEKTNFYAESGGQVADIGHITTKRGTFPVLEVQKAPHKQHLHFVDGVFEIGDQVTLEVDIRRRQRITRHHSAVHLLHRALRDVLGTHVQQAGSYVDDQRLRFDFNHFEKINSEQLKEIERRVNQEIDHGIPSLIQEMPIAQAKSKGAMALFGEKYGEVVRVVEFGTYSVELCGGCHVDNTASIGAFVIESEESISSGVRRIQAVVGQRAYEVMKQREQLLIDVASQLGAQSILEVKDRLSAQLSRQEELKQQFDLVKQKMVHATLNQFVERATKRGPATLIIESFQPGDKDELARLADLVKSQIGSFILVLVGIYSDRLALLVSASQDQVKSGIHCGQLVKEASQAVGGSGGGRPDIAQGGTKDLTKVSNLLEFFRQKLNS